MHFPSDEVVDVVEGVEIADRGDAVLLEELGVQGDHLGGGRVEADDVDAAGEGLQVGVGPRRLAEPVHHVERVFVAIEVGRLEHRAAAGLEVGDAGFARRLHGGHEIFGQDAGAVDGLKAVAEACT